MVGLPPVTHPDSFHFFEAVTPLSTALLLSGWEKQKEPEEVE